MPGFERKTPSNVIGDAIAMVASVREAVGYNIDLGLEIHRNLRPEEAITLSRELLPFASSTTKTHWLRRVWRRWSTLQKPYHCPWPPANDSTISSSSKI